MKQTKKKTRDKTSRTKTKKERASVKDWWKISPNILDAHLVVQRGKLQWDENDANEFARALWEWSKQDDALYLEEFLAPIGLTMDYYHVRLQKFDVLAHLHPIIKERLGARQRKLALQGKINTGMVEKTMRHFLKDWDPEILNKKKWTREDRHRYEDKEHQKEMIKLKAKETDAAASRLLEYFEGKQVELPELDSSKKDVDEDDIITTRDE